MRKALILGAGGTGANTIKRIQELVEWRRNSSLDQCGNIEYLEVDTDPDSLPESKHNFIHLLVTEAQAERIRRDINENSSHQWARADKIVAIQKGASATRMKGKLGFLYHYNEIYNGVKTRLNKLYNPNSMGHGDGNRKKIYIIANSVHGTGSGCFVDFAYLVKDVIRNDLTFKTDILDITLIMTLPAKLDEPSKLRNANYSLEELNHFMSGNPYTIEKPTEPGVEKEFHAREKPFDFVYLVGPKDGADAVYDSKQLEAIVGEYIYNDIFSPSADKRDSIRDNMLPYLEQQDGFGYQRCYMTFGFSTIEYPAVQIAKAATYAYVMRALEEWCPDTPGKTNFAFDTISMSAAKDKDGKDGGYRLKGTIYNALLNPVAIRTHGRDDIHINLMSMIDSIKEKAYQSFFQDDYQVSYLRKITAEIDRGLEFDSGMIEKASYAKGIIRKVVHENIRTYDVNGDESWAKRIKDVLTDYLFVEGGSIGLVLTILDELVDRKLPEIENKTETEDVAAELSRCKERMMQITEQIDYISNDVFLKAFWFRNDPIKRLVNEYRRVVDKYIDIRMNSVIYELAKPLAKRTAREVSDFRERIQKFKEHIERILVELERDYKELLVPKSLNGHIVMKDEIENIAGRLVQDVTPDTKEFIKGDFATLCKKDLAMRKEAPFGNASKKELLNSQRSKYINALSNKDVIQEFFEEEENKIHSLGLSSSEIGLAKIREIDAMSELYINMNQSDKYSPVEDGIMLKKWFFYPGGAAMSVSSDYSSNLFANALDDINIVRSWSEQSQESYNKNTILFLQERGCFPIRLLNLFKEPLWIQAIKEADNNVSIQDTFTGRIDVEFLPLSVVDADKLRNAKATLLVALAYSVLMPSAAEDQYEFGGSVTAGLYERRRPPIRIPRTYKSAAYKLYKNSSSKSKLDEAIKKKKEEISQMTFIEQLHGLLEDPGRYGLILADEQTEALDMLNVIRDEYIITDSELLAAWDGRYPEDRFADSESEQFEYVSRRDDLHPYTGFYCRYCNRIVADYTKDGNPDYTMIPEMKKFHVCTR